MEEHIHADLQIIFEELSEHNPDLYDRVYAFYNRHQDTILREARVWYSNLERQKAAAKLTLYISALLNGNS